MAHKADGAALQIDPLQRAGGIKAAQSLGVFGPVEPGVDDGHALAGLLQVPGEQGLSGLLERPAYQRVKAAGKTLPRGVHPDAGPAVGEDGRRPGHAVDQIPYPEPGVARKGIEQDFVIGFCLHTALPVKNFFYSINQPCPKNKKPTAV